MSSIVPGFGETRKMVSGIINSEDPYESTREFVAGSNDPSVLKIGEYALLVPLVKTGMLQYLENNTVFDSVPSLDPYELEVGIGGDLGERTIKIFNEHPHREVIEEFARRRAELVSYGEMIFPVEPTLRGASLFSATAMFGVAISNALAIDREMPHDLRPRAQFIDSVKKSHQPAAARAVMHLLWNTKTSDEFFEHAEGLVTLTPNVNDEAIVYDSLRDQAVLTKPLRQWLISAAHTYITGDGFRPITDG
ncbi:MAG TPA: hypothetical protein VNG32_01855, partial [Candidatus Dormibacteraeota bacterium]|nr:hypothetical protein [Candidatus Dormibacteraeota bacterium]